MTTRQDVNVDYPHDPRIVNVLAPSTEFVAQDVVDTLRVREADFEGMSYSKLLNAAGKASLGGSLETGITATLLNTQIAFEARTSAAESGTATAASGSPFGHPTRYILEDSAADFVAANIQRGSLVINFRDQSVADVFERLSSTRLEVRLLQGGLVGDFQIGDAYKIYNIAQCRLGGGNVVAVDENDQSISAVLPTAFTQVIIELDTSAALVASDAQANAEAVWNFPADPSGFAAGTMGEWVRRKLLSVAAFLGLK